MREGERSLLHLLLLTAWWPTCSPLVLRHIALRMLGREDSTSRVTGICLLMMELSTTPGKPLSCNAESWEGSWKMKTVVTSVAEERKRQNKGRRGEEKEERGRGKRRAGRRRREGQIL